MSDPARPTNADIFDRLDRIEDKLDLRLNVVDAKVDAVTSRMDRFEGRLEGTLGLVRWLGPAGVGAVLLGLVALAVR